MGIMYNQEPITGTIEIEIKLFPVLDNGTNMEDSRIPKFGELSTGILSVGRPRLCYKDSIKRDLADFEFSVDFLERVAADRGIWRSMIGVGVGCSSRKLETAYSQAARPRFRAKSE